MFEYVIRKPTAFIIGIRYFFFKRKTTEKIHPDLSNEIWSTIDHDIYGRCYTIRPTLKMIHDGIKEVRVYLNDSAEVFFHTPGMFATAGQPTTFKTTIGRYSSNRDRLGHFFGMQRILGPFFGVSQDFAQVLNILLRSTLSPIFPSKYHTNLS